MLNIEMVFFPCIWKLNVKMVFFVYIWHKILHFTNSHILIQYCMKYGYFSGRVASFQDHLTFKNF